MRGTLHLVAAEDLRWLVALLGPRFAAADRGRRHRLGLDDELAERALPAIPEVLAGRALTRAELMESLAEAGILVDVRPFGRLPARALPGLRAEVADLGRFLDEPTTLRVP